MNFKSYPKIYTNFTKDISNNENDVWIGTEKIHGTNFSFYCDIEHTIKCGKRTSILKDDEKFYDYQIVKSKCENKIKLLFDILNKKYNAEQIIIYGELCGGFYPDKTFDFDNKHKNKKYKPVQWNIYYSPEKIFIAFDIFITTTTSQFYLNYEELIEVCSKTNIYYSPILVEGSLKDVINFDIKINSKIPELFDYDEIESNKNIIEGIVIRPKYITDSDYKLKIKNNDFKEQNNKKHIISYITKNRLINVKSKYNEDIDKKELLKHFTNDIINDYNINNPKKPFNDKTKIEKIIENKYNLFLLFD
jgi:Rnl2 family RNA ligase